MKHKLIFLSLLLPYLAMSQVAKDTVTVLSPAQITAASPNDTANIYFVINNAWRKANFDSIARYTRVRFQTLTLDSTHIAASGLNLQGSRFTGTLPVNKGGTERSILTANKVLVGNGTSAVLQPTDLHWDNTNSRLGIGTALPNYRIVSEAASSGFRYAALHTSLAAGEWVGFLYGNTGSTFQKCATIYESTDGFTRGKFHIALNNTTGSANNAAIADARLTVLSNGNVGIGTTSPGSRLDIASGSLNVPATSGVTLGTAASFYHTTGDATGNFLLGTNVGGFRFVAGGTDAIYIGSTGNVGIGVNTPAYRLDVNGNFRADSIFTDIAGNAVFSTSDARLKKNIEPMSSILQKINALNPVMYEWNDLKIDQAINRNNTVHLYGKKIGLIAQEVYEIFPDFVGTDADGNMVLSYGAFIVPMIKAIQEQQTQIEQLKQRIIQLENK